MKKKRGLVIHIHLTNRWLYTFIAIGILAIIGVGVYALTPGVAPNPGHNINEVSVPSPCSSNQYLQFDGTNWKCANETDSTVKSWAKTDNPNIPGTVNTSRLTARDGYVGTGLYGWCKEYSSGCQSSSETMAPGIVSGPAVCSGTTCICLGSGYVKEMTGASGSTNFYSCYKKILS